MKLIRNFKITSDEFYDYLEEKLLQDIQQTTGKKVKAKEIKKGFRYDKKDAYTTITINDYKRHEIYSATVKSRTDFITITYQTKETKEGLQITFEEYVDSYDSVRDKKISFLEPFMTGFLLDVCQIHSMAYEMTL